MQRYINQAEKICFVGGQLKLDDIGVDQALYPTEDKLRSIGKASKSYFVGRLDERSFFLGALKLLVSYASLLTAPEVLLDDSEDSLNRASDLWALGILIFVM